MQGLHGSAPGPLHIYCGFHVQMSGFLLLVPSLGPLFSCLFVLPNSCVFVFVLPYIIFLQLALFVFLFFYFYPLGGLFV